MPKPTPVSGGGSPPFEGTYYYSSGNWVFQATPSAGNVPFTSLVGFIDEEGAGSGANDFTTAALQVVNPSSCFSDATSVPFQGGVQGHQLSVNSFGVNGQFVSVNGVLDATATHLDGNYSINQGCGNGQKGTLTGTRYTRMGGSYASSFGNGSTNSAILSIVQDGEGSGDGYFRLYGSTATFQGFSCFKTAYMSYVDSYVLGSTVHFVFVTDDPVGGTTFTLDGSINPTATQISATTMTVTGGSCAGSVGNATFVQN